MEVPARSADIAELIRVARVEAGLSQNELAQRIGSRQPVVSRWENGEDEPRLSTLRRLLRACGLSLSLKVDRHDDVDRSQIRQQLAMSPTERLASVVNLSRLLSSAHRPN
jgi:ribosome-binding protein aMBF1 (putative translation factor)